MAKLIVQSGIHAGTVFELGDAPVVIGRDFGCDIHVPDAQVSRQHARIERDGERFVITDLGSRNGTFVNGKRVEQQALGSGDNIGIGEVPVLFVGDDAEHELPPEDPEWVRPTIAETIVSDRIELLSRGLVTYSREQLEHANEGLITLFRYSTQAPEAMTVEELLERLTQAIEEAIEPDRVVPILLDPGSGERRPWLRRVSNFDRQLAKVPVSTTIIDFVFHERLSVLSHAPAEDERFRDAPSIQLNRIATAMCVPLKLGDRILGAIYTDRLGDGKPFSRTDLEVLTALAMPTVVALGGLRAREALQRERQVLEREVRGQYHIIGDDPAFQPVFDFIEKAAPLDSGVLILGESGTGKELVARAIHYSSPRAKGPFEAVNCAALNETLLESELFGHVKGAFTGADRDRPGRFELASEGTLFLDEIAEMPPSSQGKLLRVLESGEFRRVGDVRDRTSKARVVAATNKNLRALVDEKKFREDLFYRLHILTCTLPSLRERPSDIDRLCEHFLGLYAEKCGRGQMELTDDAREALHGYPWPGNVRELRNVIERVVALSGKTVIDADDLPADLRGAQPAKPADPLASLQDVERQHIERVLAHTDGNKKEAAGILGIDRSTLYAKIRAYRLQG